jgi:quinol-cytochrome oxidoreductase complex cytochrome b subunit
VGVFLILFAAFVFYNPDGMGHVENYIVANPLATPQHIVPEWYLLPYYAMLRAVPNKLIGVLTMFSAIGVLFVLPWLDTSKVRSMRYRPAARWFLLVFGITCVVLGWCGAHEPDATVIPGVGPGFTLFDYGINTDVWLSRLGAVSYFLYFIVVTPVLGLRETPLPVPESISTPVLSPPASVPAGAAAAPEKKG